MKKAIAVLIAIVIVLYGVIIIKDYSNTESKYEKLVTVTVEQGASDSQIAKILKENNLIKREWLFKLRLKNSMYEGKLKYGTFELYEGMSMADIIKVIATGSSISDGITFMIPEGYSVEMIAQKAEETGICTAKDFLKALKDDYDYAFLKDIPQNEKYKYRLQGFLFPDTYTFTRQATAHEVIDAMLGNFEKKYGDIYDQGLQKSMYEVITIASLIEKEAKLDSERKIISGVIKNRIGKDMPLQIDATVSYAITDGMFGSDMVYYKDLEVKSPYNTYKYKGLPVGPICNPGEKSIVAALNPQKHNYLYYHTDESKGDGSHIFSENYDGHLSTMN